MQKYVPLASIATSAKFNHRDVNRGLNELMIDIAMRGQDDPGHGVSMERLRAIAATSPWVAAMVAELPADAEYFLIGGHRRKRALELAIERGVMSKGLPTDFKLIDLSGYITTAEQLRKEHVRLNAHSVPPTAAENVNLIIQMRDIEKMEFAAIADAFGWLGEKGLQRVKQGHAMGANLIPEVYDALNSELIQWSTAAEYAKMSATAQRHALASGIVTTRAAREVRQDSNGTASPAERPAKMPGGGTGIMSAKDRLIALEKILVANRGVAATSAGYKLLSVVKAWLAGSLQRPENGTFITHLERIAQNENLEFGVMSLKAEAPAQNADVAGQE